MVSGVKTRKMEGEGTTILTVKNTMANGKTIRNADREAILTKTMMSMSDSGSTIIDTARARCATITEQVTRATGRKENNTERALLCLQIKIAIKVLGWVAKCMASVSLEDMQKAEKSIRSGTMVSSRRPTNSDSTLLLVVLTNR